MTHTHVISLITNPAQAKLDAATVQAVRDNLAEQGITTTSPEWLAPEEACDLYGSFTRPPHKPDLLLDVPIDWAVQSIANRRKKLLISDMDSTIIQQECIDELAVVMGIGSKVAAITERAMRGELDFAEALKERVALLKGMKEEELEQVFADRIRLMPGARTLVQTMKAHGAYTMLVSGGFTFFTARIRQACGFDEDEANQLTILEGALTGTVVEPILDKHAKLAALHRGVAQQHLAVHDVLAVGDGANDLPMIQAAGSGVAFHGKPIVQEGAAIAINHADLHALLYLQGYRKSDFVVY